jgi:hypothetical protein
LTLEHELVPPSRDDAFIRQHERRPDRRMTGERQLVAGREDPHLHVAAPCGRQHEGRLRVVHLGGNPLHPILRNVARRLRIDRELIAFERGVGEDVVNEVAHLGVHGEDR